MRRRLLPLILLAGAGCGGVEEPLGLTIDTSSLGLDPAMVSAKVRIYVGELVDCNILYVGNKQTPVIPLYESVVSVAAGADNGRTNFNKLRPSTYIIGVWGYDVNGAEVAFGCAPSVVIEDGVEAKANITMLAPP
jgi:hypothetical protein